LLPFYFAGKRKAEERKVNKKNPAAAKNSREYLLEQIQELRAQLEEAEQTLMAIRNGHVDALVFESGDKPQVYTLESPDLPYRSIVETMAAGAVTLNEDYTVLYCNAFFAKMIGIRTEQVIGSSFLGLVPVDQRDIFVSFIERSHTEKSLQELPLKTASGKAVYIHLAGGCELRDPRNTCIVFTDISARKSAEEALRTAHDKLLDEVDRRKQAEKSLDTKSRTLEEVNTALRVLLKQREGDKNELEENIVSNMKELIFPYVERLKKSRLDAVQASTVDIIEGNLREITSPIIRKMQTFDLTPKEMEVVAYLKTGKTTKQIAESLGVSPRAVEFHRYNIRKKLGLDQKKTNLRSYLLSM
jgi:PAS domain S-box-containing protein